MVLLIKVATAVQVWVSAEQWGEAVPSPYPTHWGTVTFWTNPKSWRAANWPSNSQFPATHNQTASFLSWHSFKTLVMANLLGSYWLSPVLLEESRCFASKQKQNKKRFPVNKTLQQKCYLQLWFASTPQGEHTTHTVGWSHAVPWLFKNSVLCWLLLLSHLVSGR